MKALLLAAGFGNRLGNLTKETPKPLIKVGEEPILAFCLNQLASAGVTEVVINSHYLASQIRNFLEEFDTNLKINLEFEETLLGTAGTLSKHFDKLSEEDFIVMHADNYFSDSLEKFVRAHKSRAVGKFGSLGTFETQNPKECGVLVINTDKTIREFHEKVDNPPTNVANAAIYFFTPEIRESLEMLSVGENDISRHLIPRIMTGLYTHNFEGLFVDIGTPDGLRLANNYQGELKRSNTD
jgi:mannose-1-phosphate guanylyltransferase